MTLTFDLFTLLWMLTTSILLAYIWCIFNNRASSKLTEHKLTGRKPPASLEWLNKIPSNERNAYGIGLITALLFYSYTRSLVDFPNELFFLAGEFIYIVALVFFLPRIVRWAWRFIN